MIGTTLSHFKITAKLGEGGMGEVYRAEDTKLGREVAIKILPEAFAEDPERFARFEREAHVLASLNHPNIGAIYDLAEDHGTHFLVLELAEGEDLAVRLSRGAISMEAALPLTLQIAEALEAAHEKGIVHRDLKPANVMVGSGGKVKVLDFGLAKAWEADGKDSGGLSLSPTLTAQMTQAGTLLGTAAYMSPEQARGEAVDKRSDIWALGVLLYEMLTGQQSYSGKTVTDIIAAVVTRDPDWEALPAQTPSQIRRLLARCAQKEPHERLHDIADARIEIVNAINEPEQWLAGIGQRADQGVTEVPRLRRAILWVLAIWGVVATATAVWMSGTAFMSQETQSPVVRFTLLAPDPASRFSGVSVSADGTHLAYTALGPESQSQLWFRSLDSSSAEAVPGTDGARLPFWAPDGHSVAFFARGKLVRFDLATESTRVICDAPNGRGGTWNRDGVIVFALDGQGPLHRVMATGGEPTPVTSLDVSQQERSHRFPHFLPDGRNFTYFADRAGVKAVYLQSLDTGDRTRLISSDSEAYPVPGHLLFVRDRTLMAQPFDERRLQPIGEAIPLTAGFTSDQPEGHGQFSVSENGVLAYRNNLPVNTNLAWFDRGGNLVGSIGEPGLHSYLELSLDGSRAAFMRPDRSTGTHDAWLMDLERGTESLSFSGATDGMVFAPDGRDVVYFFENQLFRRQLSTGGSETVLFESPTGWLNSPHWSADGQNIVFTMWHGKTDYDLWILMPDGDEAARPVLEDPGDQTHAQLSPDNEWIAYVSDQSGQREVYAVSFPDLHQVVQISTGGGLRPRWRRDGRELFYLKPAGGLMVVETTENGTFGAPQHLFRVPVVNSDYAVDAAGERFLINTPVGEDTSVNIDIVLNWFEELNRLVPTD